VREQIEECLLPFAYVRAPRLSGVRCAVAGWPGQGGATGGRDGDKCTVGSFMYFVF
jgi:hypothetical protein